VRTTTRFKVVKVTRSPSDVGAGAREQQEFELLQQDAVDLGPWWGANRCLRLTVTMDEPLYGAIDLGSDVYVTLSSGGRPE
jgi:hypothetical protein